MVFYRKVFCKIEIVITNKVIEEVIHFNYLGYDIAYEYEKDIDKTLLKYGGICEVI